MKSNRVSFWVVLIRWIKNTFKLALEDLVLGMATLLNLDSLLTICDAGGMSWNVFSIACEHFLPALNVVHVDQTCYLVPRLGLLLATPGLYLGH